MSFINTGRLLVGLGVFTTLAVGAVLGIDANRRYERALESIRQQLEADARLLAEHAELSIAATDIIFANLRAEIENRGVDSVLEDPSVHGILREMVDRAPQLSEVIIADAGGRIRFSTLVPSVSKPVDISDRDFFAVHRTGVDRYVGEPITARIAARHIIPVTIRITGSGGEFLGVVGVALNIGYFQGFYNRLGKNEPFQIGMFRRDGMPLKVHPEPAEQASVFERDELSRRFSEYTSGTFVNALSRDGSKWITSYRTLVRYPVAVAVAYDYDGVVAGLYPVFLRNVAMFAVFAGSMVLLVGFILRRIKAAAIAREIQLYRTVANNIPDGRIVLFNRKLRCVFAAGSLPGTEAMAGKTLWDIHSPDVVALLEKPSLRALDGIQSEVVIPLDGRLYRCVMTSVNDDDGRVRFGMSLTQDITEREHLVAELRRSQHLLNLFFSQSLDGAFFMMLDDPLNWGEEANKDFALDRALTTLRTTRVNQAMLDQYGFAEGELIGRRFSDFFAHDMSAGREVLRKLFDAGRGTFVTEERRADDSRLLVEGDYTCLYDDDNRIIGLFGVQRDITARERAEEELRESRDQIRRLLASVQNVREQEQKRIARELHDELGQLITALKLDLDWLKGRPDPAFVAEKLADLEVLTDAMRDSVRQLLAGLRPQLLQQVGLAAACKALLRDFTATSGIRHQFWVGQSQLDLSEAVAVAAYRILQEAITNVFRHSKASEVRVLLKMQPEAGRMEMRIADDGCGFDPGRVGGGANYGLLGMRERVHLLNGDFTVDSAPGTGTRIVVVLPAHPQATLPQIEQSDHDAPASARKES